MLQTKDIGNIPIMMGKLLAGSLLGRVWMDRMWLLERLGVDTNFSCWYQLPEIEFRRPTFSGRGGATMTLIEENGTFYFSLDFYCTSSANYVVKLNVIVGNMALRFRYIFA